MLTVFPNLLTYGLVAPLILRVVVGSLRIGAGTERYRSQYKWLSILYWVSSIFIIVGLYTQVSALVAIILIGFDYYTKRKIAPLSRPEKALTVLMVAVFLSLLVTGPGFVAFDLPL